MWWIQYMLNFGAVYTFFKIEFLKNEQKNPLFFHFNLLEPWWALYVQSLTNIRWKNLSHTSLSRRHNIDWNNFSRVSTLKMVSVLVEISGIDVFNKLSRLFSYILGRIGTLICMWFFWSLRDSRTFLRDRTPWVWQTVNVQIGKR